MAGRRAARRVRCQKCSESVYGFRAFGRVPLRYISRNVHSNKRRKSAAIRRFFCARWGRGLCFFYSASCARFRASAGGGAFDWGGYFSFRKPISATFLSRAESAFCKKISRARTHSIPRYGNFRAAPPAPLSEGSPTGGQPRRRARLQRRQPHPQSPSESDEPTPYIRPPARLPSNVSVRRLSTADIGDRARRKTSAVAKYANVFGA